MVSFVRLICVYTIKEYKTAFHARRIFMKDEIFISEWDKESARVHFSDKDLPEVRNAMSEDISTKRRRRAVTRVIQNSLLNLRVLRHKRRAFDPDQAEPSRRPSPQERLLLKLSNNAIHWINLYTPVNHNWFS